MINMPLRAASDAFHESWRLRWPFLLSHLAFNLLVMAILAPLATLVLRVAVAFSGQPAVSDFGIALFFASPAGFAGGVLVASLTVATLVLDVAFMMAIALHARRTGRRSFEHGALRILPRLPQIVGFAWRLVLRVLAMVLPFILAGLFVAQRWLGEYDINYYLSHRPPEFLSALAVIAALLAAMSAILLPRLLGWALALPMVLFEDVAPRDSFAASATRMRGRRLDLLLALLAWLAASAAALAVVLTVAGLIANGVAGRIGPDLGRLAAALTGIGAVWALLNLLITALSTGALACLLMERAGWPGTEGARGHETRHRPGLRMAIAGGMAISALLTLAGTADLASHRPEPDEVVVIGHRGAAGARPENTLASFDRAITDGADWVELDVQESAEGEVIVVHDSDFMKLAGVATKAWEVTAADLAEIDIGSWFGPEYAAERTPGLRQALDLAHGSGSGVLIELKYYGHDIALEQRVSDIVSTTGMDDRVMAMSLKYDGVQKMKALRPDWQVGLLAAATLGRLWELDADFLAVNTEMISARMVAASRNAGKPLFAWTVNDPLAMSQMLSLGVDGLITDEPALARRVIAQRARLSTAERLVLALGSRLGLRVSGKVYRDGSP
ncbi:glycerophosphodiester phosphodiesterase family protein [Tropicimonas sp.]|uniref:glycerophosphodiester phosphodiesterase family protein n=1 Tax=Tropicimonas sp. TaxID=2067044 RepID=UPI003A8505A5